MGKKEKKIPVNSVGKIIQEARKKQGLTEEELVWKINKPKITKKLIQAWEKGKEFPDLDSIYLLAEHLKLNPNELFNNRLRIQDESIHEINFANRRVGGKIFNVFYTIIKYAVKWIAGICIIVVAANYKNFENKMGGTSDPEQEELIRKVIDNAIEEFTVYNFNNENVNAQNTNISDNTFLENEMPSNSNNEVEK